MDEPTAIEVGGVRHSLNLDVRYACASFLPIGRHAPDLFEAAKDIAVWQLTRRVHNRGIAIRHAVRRRLGMCEHARKTQIDRVSKSFTFLGVAFKPPQITLSQESLAKIKTKLRRLHR